MTRKVDPWSTAIVYGDTYGTLVFVPKARAVELASTYEAIRTSATWGELRARMPAPAYERFLEMTGDERVDFEEFYREEQKTRPELTREEAREEYLTLSLDLRNPEPDDRFNAGDFAALNEGDFPTWQLQEMLDWVPHDIQRQYGTCGSSAVSGPCLEFSARQVREIVAAFETHGYRCERNDLLISRACGYGDAAAADAETSSRSTEFSSSERLGHLESLLSEWVVLYPDSQTTADPGGHERLVLSRDGTYTWKPAPDWARPIGRWGVRIDREQNEAIVLCFQAKAGSWRCHYLIPSRPLPGGPMHWVWQRALAVVVHPDGRKELAPNVVLFSERVLELHRPR